MQHCPNCRARFNGATECHRCGCELGPLLRIEARAQALERLAVQCMQWDLPAAAYLLERALQLQQRPLAKALRGFIAHSLKQAPRTGA